MNYQTVNDAATAHPSLASVLGPGQTEVWYYREWWKSQQIFPKAADYNPADLEKTHMLLGRIAGTDVEAIWRDLQGEFWSPNAEANAMLRRTGLSHTSMDCGDIVKLPDGTLWMVESFGFGQVMPKGERNTA